MTNPLVLHLVRHASYSVEGVLVGRWPVPISSRGRAEATALGDSLRACGVHSVLTSPQLRARQTANIIAERCGAQVSIEPGLDEIDFGEWTGMRFDQLAQDPRWHEFNTFRSITAVPGGELMIAAQSRAVGVVHGLRARGVGEVVALVSHADIVRSVIAFFLGMPLDLMQRIELAPASWSELIFYEDTLVLRALNIPPQMERQVRSDPIE